MNLLRGTCVVVTVVLLLAAPPAPAQPLTSGSLDLDDLQAAALARDPRGVQPDLLEEATRLRLDNLRAERFPQLSFSGQATYQSEGITLPIDLPNVDLPLPPLERFQAQAELNQSIYDGGRVSRQARLARASLREQQAGVAVTLYALRDAVTEAYFGALLLQAQARQLALTERDLAARLGLMQARARDGAALPSDPAVLEAELIRLQQTRAEAEADRRASLAVVARLTGLSITPQDSLTLPDLAPLVVQARRSFADSVAVQRPELERFARAQERLEAEAALARAQVLPQVSLFGQAGAARPNPFNPFGSDTEPFGLIGVRLRWQPFDWGQAQREAEQRRVQAAVTATEAAAFTEQIARSVEHQLATIDRLQQALTDDARAVNLRTQVHQAALRQLEEGVLVAVDYADRATDLLIARLTLTRHRIELARAQARYLITLGLYPTDSSGSLDRLNR